MALAPCGLCSTFLGCCPTDHVRVTRSLIPRALATRRTVEKLGLPSALKARYRLSRLSPVSRATVVIPAARAISPNARATPAASSGAVSSHAFRYSIRSAGVLRWSETSNGMTTVLPLFFDLGDCFRFISCIQKTTQSQYVAYRLRFPSSNSDRSAAKPPNASTQLRKNLRALPTSVSKRESTGAWRLLPSPFWPHLDERGLGGHLLIRQEGLNSTQSLDISNDLPRRSPICRNQSVVYMKRSLRSR